jgi:hypothetical protein
MIIHCHVNHILFQFYFIFVWFILCLHKLTFMTQGGRNVIFVFLMVSLETYHFCFLIFVMNQKIVTLIDLGIMW